MNFDYMATAAAVLYFLGAYLHYIHIATIFHLLEREEELNPNRARMHSTIWPWTVVKFIWHDIFGADDDD